MKKEIGIKMLKLFTSMSRRMAVRSVNTTCTNLLHQPKVPVALNKYKK